MNTTEKLLFLSGVKTNKATLFGSFSMELSRDDKLEAWSKIVTNLQAHGVSLAVEKPVKYFRDTVWPNLRRYTMDKKEKKSKTGESGGRCAKWTEVDQLVLDIVGKDSPAARGIRGGYETWESEETSEGPPPPATAEEEQQQQGPLPTTSASVSAPTTVLQPITGEENISTPRPEESARQPFRARPKRQCNFLSEFRRKKLVKIDLEIENLRLRNALLRKQLDGQVSTGVDLIRDGDFSYQVL